MEYRKSYKIEGKIFREDDILRLASIIKDLYMEQDHKIEYTIKSNNESSVSGNDMSIFETDYFKRKQIGKVQFEYYGNGLRKHVLVSLYNPLVFSDDSTVYMKSDDEVWLNAVNAKLDGFFDDSIPQKAIWRLPKSLWRVVIPASGSLFATLISYLGISRICRISHTALSDAFIVTMSLGLAAFFSFIISRVFPLIEEAYPRLEFQFGNHSLNKSSEIRKVWAWVLGALIIPVTLMIVSFVVG